MVTDWFRLLVLQYYNFCNNKFYLNPMGIKTLLRVAVSLYDARSLSVYYIEQKIKNPESAYHGWFTGAGSM